jgi:hypothetical protein
MVYTQVEAIYITYLLTTTCCLWVIILIFFTCLLYIFHVIGCIFLFKLCSIIYLFLFCLSLGKDINQTFFWFPTLSLHWDIYIVLTIGISFIFWHMLLWFKWMLCHDLKFLQMVSSTIINDLAPNTPIKLSFTLNFSIVYN